MSFCPTARALAGAAPALPHEFDGVIAEVAGANLLAPGLRARQQRGGEGKRILGQFLGW